MSIFVDTSALYALLDEADEHHADASDALRRLTGAQLITHGYVVVEAAALVARRLPWAATTRLFDGLMSVIDIESVSPDLFDVALQAYRQSDSARVSLVDHASFALMRSLGIRRALAYDDDFTDQGFELVA